MRTSVTKDMSSMLFHEYHSSTGLDNTRNTVCFGGKKRWPLLLYTCISQCEFLWSTLFTKSALL